MPLIVCSLRERSTSTSPYRHGYAQAARQALAWTGTKYAPPQEGADAFVASWDELIENIGHKTRALTAA